MEFGKIVIAAFLAQYEIIGNLYNSKEDWYSYLYNNFLNTSYEDFNRNYISIITFNYDRSIDCFLKKALLVLAGAHGKQIGQPLDLIEFDKNITTYLPIIHLHGQLGTLEFDSVDPNVRDYEPNHNYGELVNSSQQIHIISELSGNSESDSNFKDAHEKIKRAELICFMGFSYDDINLKRLNISKHSKNATVIGTTYGLEPAELKRIVKKHPYLDGLTFSEYESCLEILRQSYEINDVLD